MTDVITEIILELLNISFSKDFNFWFEFFFPFCKLINHPASLTFSSEKQSNGKSANRRDVEFTSNISLLPKKKEKFKRMNETFVNCFTCFICWF